MTITICIISLIKPKSAAISKVILKDVIIIDIKRKANSVKIYTKVNIFDIKIICKLQISDLIIWI